MKLLLTSALLVVTTSVGCAAPTVEPPEEQVESQQQDLSLSAQHSRPVESKKCTDISSCDDLIAACAGPKDDFACDTYCTDGACCHGTCINGAPTRRGFKAP